MLPGTFGHGTAVPTPSSVADTNTVFGAFVTVPLTGGSSKNCDEYLLLTAQEHASSLLLS